MHILLKDYMVPHYYAKFVLMCYIDTYKCIHEIIILLINNAYIKVFLDIPAHTFVKSFLLYQSLEQHSWKLETRLAP